MQLGSRDADERCLPPPFVSGLHGPLPRPPPSSDGNPAAKASKESWWSPTEYPVPATGERKRGTSVIRHCTAPRREQQSPAAHSHRKAPVPYCLQQL